MLWTATDESSLAAVLAAVMPGSAPPLADLILRSWNLWANRLGGAEAQLSRLRRLWLYDCSAAGGGALDAPLAALLAQAPRLEELGLDGMSQGVVPPCVRALTRLRRLSLPGCFLAELPEGPYLAGGQAGPHRQHCPSRSTRRHLWGTSQRTANCSYRACWACTPCASKRLALLCMGHEAVLGRCAPACRPGRAFSGAQLLNAHPTCAGRRHAAHLPATGEQRASAADIGGCRHAGAAEPSAQVRHQLGRLPCA